MTMHDPRTNLSGQVIEEVRSHFPHQMLSSVIPRSVRLSEAPSHGLPARVYDPASRGALAYAALAEELLARGIR
jgi:chromosome partitioning protein